MPTKSSSHIRPRIGVRDNTFTLYLGRLPKPDVKKAEQYARECPDIVEFQLRGTQLTATVAVPDPNGNVERATLRVATQLHERIATGASARRVASAQPLRALVIRMPPRGRRQVRTA